MTFRRRVRLDTSQVRDLRGRGASGRGLTLAGGGGLGILIFVVLALFGGDLGGQLGFDPAAELDRTTGTSGDVVAGCRTGEDANERLDCRIVGFANSIQSYWVQNADLEGIVYREAPTTLFDDAVSTACGLATADVGPFYCPMDASVYLDLTFFEDLRTMLGAEGGPMAQAFVVAHEYGHHVQRSPRRPRRRVSGHGRGQPRCRDRAPGRLLRGRLGRPRRRHRLPPATLPRRGRHRARCRRRGRRRSHPAPDEGRGRPGEPGPTARAGSARTGSWWATAGATRPSAVHPAEADLAPAESVGNAPSCYEESNVPEATWREEPSRGGRGTPLRIR